MSFQTVMSWLYNPIVLALIGTALARFPKVRTVVANKWIPYVKTALAWLAVAVGGQAVAATGGPLALIPDGNLLVWIGNLTPAAYAGGHVFGLPVGGFLGGLAGAMWQAAQAHILYRMFGHKVLGPDPADSLQ